MAARRCTYRAAGVAGLLCRHAGTRRLPERARTRAARPAGVGRRKRRALVVVAPASRRPVAAGNARGGGDRRRTHPASGPAQRLRRPRAVAACVAGCPGQARHPHRRDGARPAPWPVRDQGAGRSGHHDPHRRRRWPGAVCQPQTARHAQADRAGCTELPPQLPCRRLRRRQHRRHLSRQPGRDRPHARVECLQGRACAVLRPPDRLRVQPDHRRRRHQARHHRAVDGRHRAGQCRAGTDPDHRRRLRRRFQPPHADRRHGRCAADPGAGHQPHLRLGGNPPGRTGARDRCAGRRRPLPACGRRCARYLRALARRHQTDRHPPDRDHRRHPDRIGHHPPGRGGNRRRQHGSVRAHRATGGQSGRNRQLDGRNSPPP